MEHSLLQQVTERSEPFVKNFDDDIEHAESSAHVEPMPPSVVAAGSAGEVDAAADAAEEAFDAVSAAAGARALAERRGRGNVVVSAHRGGNLDTRYVAGVPSVKEVPESKSDCKDVLEVLAKSESVHKARRIYQLVCSTNELRSTLSKLSGGCLYVPTDKHIDSFYARVDRPNPIFFPGMLEDSFFKVAKGGPCPSEATGEFKSLTGATVISCAEQSGFVGHNSFCVATERIGETRAGGVTVYAVEGLIGLLPVWEDLVVESGDEEEVLEERQKDAGGATPHLTQTESATAAAPAVLYVGCFVNDGPRRVTPNQVKSFAECEAAAVKIGASHFGVEWPQGFRSPGVAQCHTLNGVPSLELAENQADCEAEVFDAHPMGSGYRIALYTSVLYVGCFVNYGAGRISHHQLKTFAGCKGAAASSGASHFALEYPQGSMAPGEAECIVMHGAPSLQLAENQADCEAEVFEGHPMGSGFRLAVYTRTGNVPDYEVEIPLDFYICDNGEGVVQVKDEQITAQIKLLNKAFAGEDSCEGTHAYSLQLAKTGFSFRHGSTFRITDSRCAPECVHHINSLRAQYAPVEPDKIKVFVCRTGLLGQATYPCASQRHLLINDGSLPDGHLWGFNYGKTLAHEMGHYLGIQHTFNNNCDPVNDGVEDTNPEDGANSMCPTIGQIRKTCGSVDPVHNFMDYSYDKCMCTFTRGQKMKMWNSVEACMKDIWNTKTLSAP